MLWRKKPVVKVKIMENYLCKDCKDTGIIEVEGKNLECRCMFRKRMVAKLFHFLPAPKSTVEIKNLLKKVENLSKPRKVIIPKIGKDLYKTFFIHYLVRNDLTNDFKVIPTYYLIDVFLNNIEGESMYDYAQNNFILLHGFTEMKNKQEFNILAQFVDIYRNRDILAYSDTKDTAEFKSTLMSKGFKML